MGQLALQACHGDAEHTAVCEENWVHMSHFIQSRPSKPRQSFKELLDERTIAQLQLRLDALDTAVMTYDWCPRCLQCLKTIATDAAVLLTEPDQYARQMQLANLELRAKVSLVNHLTRYASLTLYNKALERLLVAERVAAHPDASEAEKKTAVEAKAEQKKEERRHKKFTNCVSKTHEKLRKTRLAAKKESAPSVAFRERLTLLINTDWMKERSRLRNPALVAFIADLYLEEHTSEIIPALLQPQQQQQQQQQQQPDPQQLLYKVRHAKSQVRPTTL
jgi:excinuclease UvrABC ATPase subunit